MTKHKCQVDTFRGTSRIIGLGRYSPCGKLAIIELPSGDWVCNYHSPEAITKREEAKQFHRDMQAINRRNGFGRKQRTL